MPTARAKDPKPAPKPVEPDLTKFSTYFPSLSQAVGNTNAAVIDYQNNGQIARSLGRGIGGVVTGALGLADDVVGRPVRSVVTGAGEVLGGLVGASGRTDDAFAAPAVVAQVPPVVAALAQGRKASGSPTVAAITPQDTLARTINDVLNNSPSLEAIQAVGGLVPAAVKPSGSAKDLTLGQTAQLSGAIYQKALEDAKKAANGDEVAYAKEFAKATDAYFQRNAGLVGFNPAGLATAQLLTPQDQ